MKSDEEFGPVNAAFADYLILAKEFNRLVSARAGVPDSLTRKIAIVAAKVADAYCRPENWPERNSNSLGLPLEPMSLVWRRLRPSRRRAATAVLL